MAILDQTLQEIMTGTSGIIGIAVIEMNSRRLVSFAQLKAGLSPAMADALAVSAVEMVRGKAVAAIELLLSENPEKALMNSIDDICINTQHARFFLTVISEKPEFLMVLGTDIATSMGMGWMLVRQSIPLIVEKLP